jgi:hypothetical protein
MMMIKMVAAATISNLAVNKTKCESEDKARSVNLSKSLA